MDEKDLEQLIELTKKAAYFQNYDIAVHLKNARELLKKKLNDNWSKQILTSLNEINPIPKPLTTNDMTKKEILTEIYKRSITHIEGYETLKLNKTTMFVLSEAMDAMQSYADQETATLKEQLEAAKKWSEKQNTFIDKLSNEIGQLQSENKALKEKLELESQIATENFNGMEYLKSELTKLKKRSEWISVDIKPKGGQQIIGDSYGKVYLCVYNKGFNCFETIKLNKDYWESIKIELTRWQPLPPTESIKNKGE